MYCEMCFAALTQQNLMCLCFIKVIIMKQAYDDKISKLLAGVLLLWKSV